MKKLLILISLLTICTNIVSAQEDIKYWKDGKLQIQDFKGEPKTYIISKLNYNFGYKTHKLYTKDTTFVFIKGDSYMYRNSSWINKRYNNNDYLKYNQVIFNLIELQTRELQNKLYTSNNVIEYDSNLNKYSQILSSNIEEFKIESKEGENISIINKWSDKTNSDLKQYNLDTIPKYTKSNWGYGMHLGIGASYFSNSLGDHFGNSLNMEVGFDLAYKKSNIFLNFTLGGTSVDKTYIHKDVWKKDDNLRFSNINLSYGYNVLNNSKFKIIPFVGLQYIDFSKGSKDDDDLVHLDNINFILGINSDFKIKTFVYLIPNIYSKKEITELSIRARLYIAKTNFYSDLKGYSVNFSLSFNMFGNWIK